MAQPQHIAPNSVGHGDQAIAGTFNNAAPAAHAIQQQVQPGIRTAPPLNQFVQQAPIVQGNFVAHTAQPMNRAVQNRAPPVSAGYLQTPAAHLATRPTPAFAQQFAAVQQAPVLQATHAPTMPPQFAVVAAGSAPVAIGGAVNTLPQQHVQQPIQQQLQQHQPMQQQQHVATGFAQQNQYQGQLAGNAGPLPALAQAGMSQAGILQPVYGAQQPYPQPGGYPAAVGAAGTPAMGAPGAVGAAPYPMINPMGPGRPLIPGESHFV